MKSLTREHPRNLQILLAASLFIFIALLCKNSGLYPFVFGDEFTYSQYSRQMPLSESMIPGYLYLAIYSLTSHCAADFLGCARIFNALFFVSAAPFIYWVARRVAGALPSLLIAVCALIGPINIYTAHYMPESFYFFGFWVLMWSIARTQALRWQDWALSGFILGCTALIKPHSMLFMPALLIYIGYVSLKTPSGTLKLTARNLLTFLIAALIAKFAISLWLAGPAGLTFFGPSYNKIASSTTGLARLIELVGLALISIKGHVLALCLMVGLPMAVMFKVGLATTVTKGELLPAQKLAVLGVLLIANLVAVVGLFSASVVSTSIYESMMRLHMRYYDFMFPLMWIVVASTLTEVRHSIVTRIVPFALVLMAMLYAIYTAMAPFEPNIIDSVELRSFLLNSPSFYLMAALGVLALVGGLLSPRVGAHFFLYLALPVTLVLSNVWATREQRLHLVPDVNDRAGIFARDYLTPEERTHVVILGADTGGLLKAGFYLDNRHVTAMTVGQDNQYDFKGLPPDKQWMLSIGAYVPPANGRLQIHMDGFTLTRISGTETIDASLPQWPRVIVKAEGLGAAESWGRWSTGDTVTFGFDHPLATSLIIRLDAAAFGPNVGQAFMLRIGSEKVPFTLDDQFGEIVLRIENPGSASVLSIDIPQAVSPQTLQISPDERKLGIAVKTLQIESVEQ